MAGDEPTTEWIENTVSYITTGAPVPDKADAVVQVEDTDVVERFESGGERVVNIRTAAEPGQNIRSVGSDIQAGETILQTGTRLTPDAIGLLAMVSYRIVQSVGWCRYRSDTVLIVRRTFCRLARRQSPSQIDLWSESCPLAPNCVTRRCCDEAKSGTATDLCCLRQCRILESTFATWVRACVVECSVVF